MVYYILLAVAAVLSVLAYLDVRKRLAFLNKGRRALAIVVKLEETKDSDGDILYAPLFRYHTDNGYECTYQPGIASTPPQWQVGQTATIAYDPADPTNAELLTYFGVFRRPVLLAAAAAPCWIVGIGYLITLFILN